MGVAAANEHKILGDRNRLPHHPLMPQRRPENETVRTSCEPVLYSLGLMAEAVPILWLWCRRGRYPG